MAQQDYAQFYRHFGVRKLDQLTRPPMTRIKLFDFPRLSLFHFLGDQAGRIVGPQNDEYWFRLITKPIVMENITELRSRKGPVIARKNQIQQSIRHYLKDHRRYRPTTDLGLFETTPATMAVVNYGFMPLTYHYRVSLMTKYYAWYNFTYTVLSTAADIANTSLRHQFIPVKLPTVLPSVSDLRQASTMINQTSLRRLHEEHNYLILEIWKWLGDARGDSMFDLLPSQHYDRINLLVEESGRFTVLNLGILNQLRRPVTQDEAPKNGLLTGALPAATIQRRFLQFLMLIYQNRSVDGKITAVDATGETPTDTGVPDVEDPNAKKDLASSGGDNPNRQHTGLRQGNATTALRVVRTGSQGQDQSQIIDLTQSDDTLNQDHSDEIVDKFALSAGMEALISKNLEALQAVSDHVYLLRRQATMHDEEEEEFGETEQGSETRTIHHSGLTSSSLAHPLKETRTEPVIQVETHAIHHNYKTGIDRHLTRLSTQGLISPAEANRYRKLGTAYESIPSPDNHTTLDKFVVVDPKAIQIEKVPTIPDRHTIFDKSMLDNSLEVFDTQYVKETLQKDIAAMVLSLQHAGYAITEYEATKEESIMGDRMSYRARVVPIQGAAGMIHFDIPDVSEDGVFTVNGSQYRLRKQSSNLPIRKMGQDEVILSSYYGKLFVRRDAKRVNDYGAWIARAIMEKGFDQSNQTVTGFHPNNVFDPAFTAPRLFTILASNFSNFDVSPLVNPEGFNGRILHFELDHRKHTELRKDQNLWSKRTPDEIMIGYTSQKELLSIDQDNRLRVYSKVAGKPSEIILLPSFEAMVGLEQESAPVDFAVAKVQGKNIPVGVMLAYYSGLQNLLTELAVTPRRVPARGRLNLEAHEYTLSFADETLIFSRKDAYAALLLAGFNDYHKALRSYSVHEFDQPSVYLNILASTGLSARHIREMDLLRDMFLDPITKEKLIEMKEPYDFIPLVMKAVELLTTDNHPRITDGSYKHIKGYERMAGLLYGELVSSVRDHRSKVGHTRMPLDIHPYAVWQAISEDTSKALVKDINPIENLKQAEAVTASGTGGVGGRMMSRVNRIYDKNDMGVISEATVDSADTAVNTYLCASPLFNSVRGTAKRYEDGKTGPTSLFSTSGLASVASDRDDGKRLNYLSIQHGHGVPSKAYHAQSVRTGYEQVIPYRTSDLFAYTAKQDGKVESVTEHGIVVRYKDGSTKSIETGRRYGLAEGAVIPHRVVSNVKQGQVLKRGDLVSYHPDFFEQDPMNPGHVLWKSSITVRVALMENISTHEDASVLTRELADQLTTETTYVRSVIVNFDQSISRMNKPGATVDVEDVLCVVEDPSSHAGRYYDESSLDTLRVLQSHVPTAKTRGTIERVEMFYRGDKSEMSESLRALANAQDRQLAVRLKALNRTVHTAEVGTDFRMEGEALLPNTAVLQFYITATLPSGVGD